MSITQQNSVFTVPVNMINTTEPLPYKIYINSSAREGYDRFVCIAKDGQSLSEHDLQKLKDRFHSLYVQESDRGQVLKAFSGGKKGTEVEKGTLIKDSAIKYLGDMFSEDKVFTTETLTEALTGCRDVVHSMLNVIRANDMSQIQKLIGQLSFHDFYTFDHSINVSMYCIAIYRLIKPDCSDRELQLAGLGGLLHDIGKIKISTSVINSPNKLSAEEAAIIRKHPGWGFGLLNDEKLDPSAALNNKIISQVIYQHHENYDGSGYPNNIRGEDIHALARVTAMADFYDAVTTQRSYHQVLDPEEAINLMKNSSGKKLDPNIFKKFNHHVCEHHNCKIDHGYDKSVAANFDPCQPHSEAQWQTRHQYRLTGHPGDIGRVRLII